MDEEKGSKGFRKAIPAVMFSLAAVLLILMADTLSAGFLLSRLPSEAAGVITAKNRYHSKTGYQYYLKYSFTLDGREYRGKRIFGLLDRSTRVSAPEYENYEVGSDVTVIYSGNHPEVSRLKGIEYRQNYLVWELLGIVIFSLIGINEIRSRRKKTPAC